jgi:hypothetical protein
MWKPSGTKIIHFLAFNSISISRRFLARDGPHQYDSNEIQAFRLSRALIHRWPMPSSKMNGLVRTKRHFHPCGPMLRQSSRICNRKSLSGKSARGLAERKRAPGRVYSNEYNRCSHVPRQWNDSVCPNSHGIHPKEPSLPEFALKFVSRPTLVVELAMGIFKNKN